MLKNILETEDYNNRLEKQIDSFMTNEKQKELIELFSQKETKKSRGCCSECGEGYDNEEEWLYNTECEVCGHPIPENLIVKNK